MMAALKRTLKSVMGTVGSVKTDPSKYEEDIVIAFEPTGATRYARGTRSCAQPILVAAQRMNIFENPSSLHIFVAAILA
jgi:hypothetical protein